MDPKPNDKGANESAAADAGSNKSPKLVTVTAVKTAVRHNRVFYKVGEAFEAPLKEIKHLIDDGTVKLAGSGAKGDK